MPFIEVFQKYADFGGRAKRSEFWSFAIVDTIIRIALFVLALQVSWWLLALLSLYGLVVFIPGWAVTVRRLHDTGRSGWWLLLSLVPLGVLVLFIFYLMGSDGDNEYGPEPR